MTVNNDSGKQLKMVVPAFEDYHRSKLYFAQMIFLLGILMKQFYFFPSGTFQVGDLLLMAGCVLYVCIVRRGRIFFDKTHWWYFAFLCGVFVVNAVYSILLKDTEFVSSTLYYVFNFIIILVFSNLLREENMENFLRAFGWVLKLSILLQGSLYVLGLGNWQSGMRYIGTFHDPNQFGVFVLFSMFFIYLSDQVIHKRFWFVWDIIGTLVIFPSASTGTMIGIVLFWVGMYISNFRRMKKLWKIFWGIMSGLFVLIFLVFGLGVVELPNAVTSHFMYIRIGWKLQLLFGNGGIDSLIGDRVWNRVVEAPQYFLYGSGEGANLRFDATGYELHSSILAPAFCYGAIPYLLLLTWVFKKIGHSRYLFIYVAMFAEALFVVNTRQPMYWMLMVMADVTLRPKYEQKKKEREEAQARTVFLPGLRRRAPEAVLLRG